jgi:hypothetical protein
MNIESRLARAEKWAEDRKPQPAFVVVDVFKPNAEIDGLCFVDSIDHTETIPFSELLNADGSFKEEYHFRRFESCNLSDVDKLLQAWTIEAERYAAAKEKGVK